jgi:hypothetical protein
MCGGGGWGCGLAGFLRDLTPSLTIIIIIITFIFHRQTNKQKHRQLNSYINPNCSPLHILRKYMTLHINKQISEIIGWVDERRGGGWYKC